MGRKHAECRDCGDVLHVPWGEASDADMAILGWVSRLRAGCATCGGPLKPLVLNECAECAAWDAA